MENLEITITNKHGKVVAKTSNAVTRLSSSDNGLKTLSLEVIRNGKYRGGSSTLVSLEELIVLKSALDNFLSETITNTKIQVSHE